MNAFEWVMLTKSGKWGLAVAVTLSMLAGAVVVAQDEAAPAETDQLEMTLEEGPRRGKLATLEDVKEALEPAPPEMIPVFQVNTQQMPAPRYIRLEGNVDCAPTNDGGMFCFETPATMTPEPAVAE